MNSREYVFEEKENRKQMFNSQAHSLNLKDSSSTRQFSQVKSQDNLHVLKLQSKALQLLRKLQHQKFQIVTLTDQTQTLMKNCDDQKSYLKTVNVDMMKQEYEEQILMLSEEKQKLINLIMGLKQQKALWHQQKQEKLNNARYENEILSQKIEKALLQKQELLKIASQNKFLKEQKLKKIAQQQETLDQLRHVQRKVVISIRELQELRKKQSQL